MAVNDLPDGFSLDSQPLPDGYTLDDQGTAQITGAARLPLMGGSALSSGLGQAISTPGDIAQLYDAYIGAPFARAVGNLTSSTNQPLNFGKVDPVVSKQLQAIFPTSPEIANDLKNAGITQRPDLTPQTSFEKYLTAGAQGAGSVIPYTLMGDLPMAANVLMQGAGSGIADQAVDSLAPDNKPLQAAAAMTGGMAGGSLGNLAQKGVNAASGVSPIIQAYQDADVTPRMVGDVSGSPTMKKLQTLGGNKGAQQTLDEFGNSVENLANNFGNASTLQEAGTFAQNDAKKWLDNANATDAVNWQKVNQIIPSDTPVPANNTLQALSNIKASAAGNSSAEPFLTSTLGRDVDSIIKNQPVNSFDFTTGQRNIGYQPLQWQTMAAVRSRVGEYLSNPTAISDAGQAQAKQLYAGLSQDMQSGAMSQGPQALQAFQDANAFTAQKHDYVDNVLSNIINKDPEVAAKSLLNSGTFGGTTLQALRQNMPDTADQLAAVSLRRIGAGASEGASGNEVSPSRWLSNQDPVRKLSPEAAQALFNDPNAQKTMSALDTVAQNMRDTESYANHSNTASHANLFGAVRTGIEGGILGHELGGAPGAAFGSLAGFVSPFATAPVAGALTNSPSVAKFMAANSGQTNLLPTAINASRTMIPFALAPSYSGAQ